MRKELTVFGATIDKGEEFSVASVARDRNFIVLGSSSGKFTAKLSDLEDALKALKEFHAENTNDVDSEEKSEYPVIEYGE